MICLNSKFTLHEYSSAADEKNVKFSNCIGLGYVGSIQINLNELCVSSVSFERDW